MNVERMIDYKDNKIVSKLFEERSIDFLDKSIDFKSINLQDDYLLDKEQNHKK